MSARADAIGAVLLAGGRARRLGGIDKGLVSLHGEPLAAWVGRRLAVQVDHLIISANRNADAYAALGYPVVADSLPDQPGPLAGLLAAADRLAEPWLLSAPCDTPFLPADLAGRLRAAAQSAGVPLARARAGGQTHFAVMLCRRELLADLAAYLAAGGRQVQAWQARHPHIDVDFPDPAAFFNINTEADLAEARAVPVALP